MRRRLNVKFLILVLVVSGLFCGGVHFVHGYQQGRNAGALRRRGEQAERRGDLAEAETYLRRYLAFRPDDDGALASYGSILERRAKSYAERLRALQVLERALARSPERTDLRRQVVNLAMAGELRRYRDARDHLLVLLKTTPEDGELEGQLARCLEAFAAGEDTDARQAGDPKAAYAEAARWYTESIKHAPGRVESYVRLAALLRGPLKDPERADRIMEARGPDPNGGGLISRNAESAAAYLARAQYRKANRIEGVQGDLDRALALAPDDVDTLLAAAEAAGEVGDLDRARDHLRLGVDGHPREPRLYLALAAVEARSGRFKDEVACLERGLKALPDDARLQWSLADGLIRSGRADEASAVIETLRKHPGIFPPTVDFLSAQVLFAKGDLAAGVRLLDKSRSLLPPSAGFQELAKQADLMLAAGYGQLGNPERQLAAFRRVLGVDPKSEPALLGQAAALLAEGKTDEAIAAYQEALPLVPAARPALARLLVARNLRLPEDQRHWDEVDSLLQESVAANGPDPLEAIRAQVLVARGRADEARARLLKARDGHPEDIGTWMALAALASSQGKPADGLAVLDEAGKQLGDRVELRLARIPSALAPGGEAARDALKALARDSDRLAAEDRLRLEDGLAGAFARLGDFGEAARLWSDVLKGRPRDLRVASLLFDLASQTGPEEGRPEAARQAIESLRQMEGEDGSLWRYAEATRSLELARRGDKGRLGSVHALLDEIRARRPDWSRVSLLEAELAEIEGDRDRAADAYQRAIQQGERRPDVVRRATALLRGRGRAAEADRLVRHLVEQAPPTGPLAQLAAEMSLQQKDQQSALAFARRAVRPDSPDVRDHLWLGQVLWASGQTAEAEAEFRRAVTMAGSEMEPHVALVQFLAGVGRKDQAEEAIAAAKKALPSDVAPLALARCLEAIGRPDQAREQYQLASKEKPGDNDLRMAVANNHIRTGQFREAEVTLRAILEPSSAATPGQMIAARRGLALCLGNDGDEGHYREALELVEANLRKDAGSIDDRRLRALLLLAKPARRREAIRTFEELAQRSPPTSAEKFLLARLYAVGEEWPKARDILLGLLASDQANPPYLAALADGFLKHDRPGDAEPLVARLEQAAPKAFSTVGLKAQLLQKQGKGDQAVNLLEEYARPETIAARPVAAILESLDHADRAEAMYRLHVTRSKRPEAALDLALFLGRTGRVREALDVCEAAWKTCPAPAVSNACLFVLSSPRADEEQRRRAAVWIEEAIRKTPNDPRLLFDLANLQMMRGDYAAAEARLRQIVALSPGTGGPMNNLAWLLAVRGEKTDEALDLINRAIALDGPSPDLLDTRALVYLAMGRGEPALNDLKETVSTAPTATSIFHLARAQLLADRREDARESLRKAKAAGLDENVVDPLERETYRSLVAALAK